MASITKRPNGTWRARFYDSTGKQQGKVFARKVDAQRWLDEQTAAIVTGQYVDPKAGNVTFREYAERWRTLQPHRPSSAAHVETMLRRHVYPVMGDRKISSILPSDVQALVSGSALAPATIGVIHGIISTVFGAAIRDRLVIANPCGGTKLPKVTRRRVVPLPIETVGAIRDALPDVLQTLVTFAAGTGLRQGECFGLTVDRLDMLRRTVKVDRQLVAVRDGAPVFGPPKTDASDRVVPLPAVVVDALAAHLKEYGPRQPGALVFTLGGRPVTRQAFGFLWRPIARELGLPARSGLHALRHFYASLLIRHGESVKVVQARLGHASAAETLDTYSHLWPDSDDRTRDAVDSVLGAYEAQIRHDGS